MVVSIVLVPLASYMSLISILVEKKILNLA